MEERQLPPALEEGGEFTLEDLQPKPSSSNEFTLEDLMPKKPTGGRLDIPIAPTREQYEQLRQGY
jgi:hypothetical protein